MAPTMRTGTYQLFSPEQTTLPAAGSSLAGFYLAGVTGALPNPYTAGQGGGGTFPRVGFRVA